jgi:hypothetical protein
MGITPWRSAPVDAANHRNAGTDASRPGLPFVGENPLLRV